MKFARFWIFLLAAGGIQAQTAVNWDNSGNSMLKGTYYFRQVYYVLGDCNGDLGEAVTIYGGINFDGNGNYTVTAANGAQYIDTAGGGGLFTSSGTYSIASSGYGFLSSPYVSGDTIYGLVSAQGVFVGSSTDTQTGYNDLLIAAPLASPALTNSSFTGNWTLADFDLSSGSPQTALSSVITLNPDGAGNLNVRSINGYEGVTTGQITQTVSGLKYSFSSGAAVATFPNNGSLLIGQKYFYFSPDGNFLFGGSPITSATPYDFIVGVKTTTTPTMSGLYFQAGFDEVEGDLDSFFGSFDMIAGGAPQTYLGHERVNNYGGVGLASSCGGGVSDFTYSASVSLNGGAYADTFARYIAGDGGAVWITSGVGPSLGMSIAVQAPTVNSSSGVFINPQGILNSASSSPFTASIAPGELLTMYGSNLAAKTVISSTPFQTALGNVQQVNIGGYPAAIYYVSQGQLSAIVPYEVTPGSIVNIQVTNDQGASNVVTAYVGATAPGVFTQNQNGTGYGEIEHLQLGNSKAALGSVVTDASPALESETLAVYLTGLGAVSPAVADGAVGPSSPNSSTTNTIGVGLGLAGAVVTNDFAGLAPTLSGLYQLNITLPASGLTSGPNLLAIAGPDTYMQYPLLPVSATTGSSGESQAARAAMARVPPKFDRTPGKVSPSVRGKKQDK